MSLWRTDLAYFWVINCEPTVQDDMHYHENDDHIFMVIEGECAVRTPRKEFVLRQFDTVLLKSGESINFATPEPAECFSWEQAMPASTANRARASKIFPAISRCANPS